MNEASAVILITHDADLRWSRVTFATPARVTRGMQIDAFMMVGDTGGRKHPARTPRGHMTVNACVPHPR